MSDSFRQEDLVLLQDNEIMTLTPLDRAYDGKHHLDPVYKPLDRDAKSNTKSSGTSCSEHNKLLMPPTELVAGSNLDSTKGDPVTAHHPAYKCGNCGKLGHCLAVCPLPVPTCGYLVGCPLCNTRRHGLDTCDKAKNLPDEAYFYFLVTLRRNLPPILCSKRWWTLLPKEYDNGFPYSGLWRDEIGDGKSIFFLSESDTKRTGTVVDTRTATRSDINKNIPTLEVRLVQWVPMGTHGLPTDFMGLPI
ncbi:hypothetical protein MKZ38_004108 [Zalerion maritima]|uniref:CCHC-type domain-containing protein n=1 Tax=Zalerion maritima TaxID=339359 RepID=A0AAD5WWZ6_9PEZI|nr:hypothetical protein MKZ38_004108 [Zalerion maritima]